MMKFHTIVVATTALLVAPILAKKELKKPECPLNLDYRCGTDGQSIDICRSGKWEYLEGCQPGYFCVFDAYAKCSNDCGAWPERC
jgi:hypothetical protein